MSQFDWTYWRISYSSTLRKHQEEYNGWWNHIAFGFFVFTRKKTPGWTGYS